MKKTLLVLGFSVLFVVAGTYDVEACRCFGPRTFPELQGNQTCGLYWGADAVFIGTVEKIEVDQAQISTKVTLSVEKPLRGVTGKTVEIFTSLTGGMCGYPFEQGERYFVYSRKDQSGRLTESLCGPTVKLADAKNDLEYVKEIEEGKLGTRLSGSVFEDAQGIQYDVKNNKPLRDIAITIRSEKNTYKTRTDENGIYVFKDLPKDRYRVSLEVPQGATEIDWSSWPSTVFMNPCAAKPFRVTRKGSVSGRVVDFPVSEIEYASRESAQPQLTLIPLDERGDPVKLPSAFREAWAFRDKFEYSFKNIPSGRYLIAMNPKNCPYPNNGIGTMYYPGVRSVDEAKVITVKDGEDLVLKDFRSLPTLKVRWIAGKVVDRDGSPVPNANVRLTAGPFTTGGCWYKDHKSDELGRFRIRGFETYRYEIWASIETVDGQRGSKSLSLPENSLVDELVLVIDRP